MKLFRLYYTLQNNASLVVGMVADNREQAIATLKARQKNIKSIDSIFIGEDIHAFTDNIVDNLIQNSPKLGMLKKEIQYLKNLLHDSDDEIERLQNLGASSTVQPTINVNEVTMLHNKIVALEMENMNLRENKPAEVEKPIVEQVEDKKPDSGVICPICNKTFKSERGLKIHTKSQHKE